MLLRCAAYEPEWARDPLSWEGAERGSVADTMGGFLRHLWQEWPVPSGFQSVWWERGSLRCPSRDWFCALAQGRSLRKLESFPREISNRALHAALQAPPNLSMAQAIRWGQMKVLGAPEQFVERVLHSSMVGDFLHEAVWSRLLQKWSAAGSAGSFEWVAEILQLQLAMGRDAYVHELLRLPMSDLLRCCREHWRLLAQSLGRESELENETALEDVAIRRSLRNRSRARWSPMSGLLEFEYRESVRSWRGTTIRFEERLSLLELEHEARELRHCVAGYWRKCLSGRSAIFSCVSEIDGCEKRLLTLEVEVPQRRVIQVRGYRNRAPMAVEWRWVTAWARRQGFQIAV